MEKSRYVPDRRRVIMLGVLLVPMAASKIVHASESAEMVQESDDLAKQLGYKHRAQDVDTAKFPKRAGDGVTQLCSGCQFYANPDDPSAGCVIFGGKQVKGGGWCNSWFKRAA